jgi:hypothetical protein
MAIKRKDGTIFKLNGPNPIMKNQSFWDDETIVHNLKHEEFVTSLEDIETEDIIVEIKDVPLDQVETRKKSIPREVHRETIHCLPSIIKEFRDPLYDEVRTSISYGSKFTFEVATVTSSDISLTLWTNSHNPPAGSILYIPDKKRWWKVTNTESSNDGFMIYCLPSDLQPSFD